MLTDALAIVEEHKPNRRSEAPGTILGSTLSSFRKANQFVLNGDAHVKKINVTRAALDPFLAKLTTAESLAENIEMALRH